MITLLALVPLLISDRGYQPGQSWRGEVEWFGGPTKGVQAADEVTPEQIEARLQGHRRHQWPLVRRSPRRQEAEIDRAIRGAETSCRFEFSVYVGAVDGRPSPTPSGCTPRCPHPTGAC